MEIVFESLHLFRLPSQRVDSRQRFNEYLDEIGTVCNIYVLRHPLNLTYPRL